MRKLICMDWIIILVMAGVSFLSHSLVGTVQARGYDLAGARGWGGGCLGGRVLRCVPWGVRGGDRGWWPPSDGISVAPKAPCTFFRHLQMLTSSQKNRRPPKWKLANSENSIGSGNKPQPLSQAEKLVPSGVKLLISSNVEVTWCPLLLPQIYSVEISCIK